MKLNDCQNTANWFHPRGLVAINLPQNWQAHEAHSEFLSIDFHPREDRNIRLRLRGIPHKLPATPPDENSPVWLFLTQALPQAGLITDIQPSTLLAYTACSGRFTDNSKVWVCFTETMLFYLSVHCPEDKLPLYQSLFEHMLSSFRTENTRESRLEILRHEVMTEYNHAHQDGACQLHAGQLRLGSILIFVENLLASIDAAPHQRRQLIQEFVNSTAMVSRQSQSIGHETWRDARQTIFPMIRPDAILAVANLAHIPSRTNLAADNQQQVTATPWLDNLVICYAINSPDSLRFLLNSDLTRWNISQSTLHQHALLNLKKIRELPLASLPSPTGGLSMALAGDSPVPAKSTWLLHPRLFRYIQPHFRSPILATIPNRDTLVLLSAKDHSRDKILKVLRSDFHSSHHPISDRIFQVTQDGIVLA